MPAASETAPCPADCPCRTHKYLDAVPYRDAEDCPTDELLLQAWWSRRCSPCLILWAERVWKDPRYNKIVHQVQRQWPRVDVSDLLQTVVAEVCEKKNQGWKSVGACFRRALLSMAYDENRHVSRVAPQTMVEETAECSATTEVPASTQHMRELLDDCLERLSDKDMQLQEAVYHQRLSLIEVAKRFGQTHGAVHKQVSRLREKLRDCIGSKE